MKYSAIFIILALTISIATPTSFAQQAPNCTFGGTTTPLQEKFAKDLAVKEFIKQNPNATKSIPNNEHGEPKNQFILSAKNNEIQETLALHFNIDEKGCYIPARYHYSYDDGVIDVVIVNTIGNFTEIMNLIKLDSKTIDDFYPKGCRLVELEHSVSNGKVYGICKQGTSITMLADMYSDGIFTVDIPIEMVYSLPSSDCIPTGDFIVIANRGSPMYDITESDIGNSVSIELEEGFHRIQIAGTMIIPSPAPSQYCGIVEGYNKPYMSPLDQIDHNMNPKSVKCNSGLVLVLKYDGSPACIKSDSHKKLFERGWTDMVPIIPKIGKIGTYDLSADDAVFEIKYHITGAHITEMSSPDHNVLEIILNAPYDGSLEITLPRELIDAKIGDVDDAFFVIVDENEIDFEETSDEKTRTLSMKFDSGSKKIEIIGTESL